MNMVSDAANTLAKSAQAVNCSAQVFVEARLPLAIDQRSSFFRRKYQMVM